MTAKKKKEHEKNDAGIKRSGRNLSDAPDEQLTRFKAVREISDIGLAEKVQKNQYLYLNGTLEITDSAVFSLDRKYRPTSFNSHHAMVMKRLYDADIELGRSIFDYQSVKEDQVRAKHNIGRALAGEHVTEEAFSGEEGRSCHYFEQEINALLKNAGEQEKYRMSP